jgi:molybdopterin-guanine dinucleotide biosynthesis protein B
MVPVISFIGWQDSGKTTLAAQVVSHLREKGLRIAVIKSSGHACIPFDTPGTDTDKYRQAGADSVMLVAPDQMVLFSPPPETGLALLAHRYFYDYDLVIGEGFKNERKINKIEVRSGNAETLRDKVTGVVALVTDLDTEGENIFRFDESRKIADFIAKRLIEGKKARHETAVLLVNGRKVPMKGFVQEALAGTVHGFVKTLKQTGAIGDIDLKIKFVSPTDE